MSLSIPGVAAVIVVKPRATSWALLEEGDSVLSVGADGRSDVHALILWTELSKLLCRKVSALGANTVRETHLM